MKSLSIALGVLLKFEVKIVKTFTSRAKLKGYLKADTTLLPVDMKASNDSNISDCIEIY